jgi:hypothetical protein
LTTTTSSAVATPEESPRADRRASRRYVVSAERREGSLKIGSREFPVEILDESAHGFSVAIEQNDRCIAGKTALLRAPAGWSEVQLIHVFENDASAQGGEQSEGDTRTRLGLLRLRDLDPSEFDRFDVCESAWEALRRVGRPFRYLLSPLAMIVGLLVAVPLVAVVVVRVLEQAVPAESNAPAAPRRAATVRHAPAAAPSEPTATEPASEPVRAARLSPPISLRTPVARMRPNPKVAELLALNRRQVRDLSQAFNDYVTSAEQVVDGATQRETASLREAELGARGLAVLTEKQTGALMRLVLRPEVLMKRDIIEGLALSDRQLEQLRDAFDEYESSVKDAAPADSGATVAAGELDPDVRLGRRGLAVLSPEQHGRLLQLLAHSELFDGANPAQPVQGKHSA